MINLEDRELKWSVIPLAQGSCNLPRLFMPSVVQLSANDIVIAFGGKRDIYLFNVAKRTLSKTAQKSKSRANFNVSSDFMPTILTKQTPKVAITVDESKGRLIFFSPWTPF